MQKAIEKTTLYKLINAGHLARQTMLVPLFELGLTAGDDAILFALNEPNGVSIFELSQITGLSNKALEVRLAKLERLNLLTQKDSKQTVINNIQLTAKGIEVCDILIANWQQLDDALIGELSAKKRKNLKNILKRFVKLLSL